MLAERTEAMLQEAQYAFPYHHIPHFEPNGWVSLTRRLPWGLRYLCYQLHVRETVTALEPDSVLDLGCGDGFFIGGLPDTIANRVGIDLSERAIAFAKAFHPECRFFATDGAELTEQFDVVAAIEVLEHVPDDGVAGFLQTVGARMKHGGAAIVTVPTTIVPLSPKHYRHYDRSLFETQLAASGAALRIERVEYLFAKPWWFDALRWSVNNRYFRLELRPLLQWAWRRIWSRHRHATADDGSLMMVVLRRD
jgi:SAM-dependent methyltransferase